jgi:hypothetical protein
LEVLEDFQSLNLLPSSCVGPDRLVNEICEEGTNGPVGQLVGVRIPLIGLVIGPQHVGGWVGQQAQEVEDEDGQVAAQGVTPSHPASRAIIHQNALPFSLQVNLCASV